VSYTSEQEVVWESSQKFNTEHIVELFELYMSQVFGQQVRGIVFTINKVKGDEAFIYNFTNVVEADIYVFGLLFRDGVGGDKN